MIWFFVPNTKIKLDYLFYAINEEETYASK